MSVSIVSVLLGMAGCSSAPPSDGAKSTASAATSAIRPTDSSNVCDPGLLAWNLGAPNATHTCAGGLQYASFNAPCVHVYPPGGPSDPNCPEVDVPRSHTIPASCNWADNMGGIVHHDDQIPTKSVRVCCDPDVGPCNKPLCVTVQQKTTTCDAMAQGVVAAYRGGKYNGEDNGGQPWNWGGWVTYDNENDDGTYCSYDLLFTPVNWHVNTPSQANCGSLTIPDPTLKTWPRCSDPGYVPDGRACTSCNTSLDDHTCGETSDTELDFGSSFSQVPTTDLDTSTLQCLTDENNPIGAASASVDVPAKYGRLTAELALAQTHTVAQGGTVPVVNDDQLAQKIIQEIKLLFELYGDSLPASAQSDIVQKYYLGDPDAANTPSCGILFAPPDTSQCQVDVSKLNAEMEFCARMTGVYISDSVRNLPVVQSTCVTTLAQDIGALRPTLFANDGADDGTTNGVGGTTDAGADAAQPPAADPSDVCAFKTYRAQYDTYVTNALEARIEESSKDPRLTADQPELLSRVTAIDAWYRALSTNLYPYNATERFASAVQGAAWQHATQMENVFWTQLYQQLFPAAPVTAGGSDGGVAPITFTAAQLAALTQDTLDADRAFLTMLFTPTASGKLPIDSAPLLLLVADALEGMSQRIHSVGIYHDMGCAYIGCGPATQSELVWLVDLLAAIPSQSQTQTLLDAINQLNSKTPGSPAVGPEWLAIFTAVASQHAGIEAAVQSASSGDAGWTYAANGQSLLAGAPVGTVPVPAKHLAGIIGSAATVASTYATTGLFNAAARNRLPSGVSQDNVELIRSDVDGYSKALLADVAGFDANLSTMANAVVQEIASKTSMTNSIDQMKEKAVDYDNTSANIAGLVDSLEANEKDFGSFVNAYTSLTAFDDGTLISAQPYGPWKLDGTSAKASGPIPAGADVSLYAAQTIDNGGKGIAAGTILTIQVGSGDKWSPTCALQLEQANAGGLKSPTAPGTYPIDLSNAFTGPEGFVITQGNGTSTVQQNQTGVSASTQATTGVEGKMCIGNKTTLGFEVMGTGDSAYIDMSVCGSASLSATGGASTSNSTTQGGSATESLNFASGFRLPTTPVPTAPVGSLLAVVTDHGQPTSVRDILVVQAPATSLILDASSDVYLLTNDVTASGCTVDPSHQLTVGASSAVHQGEALAWVQPGLAAMSTFLDGLGDGDPSGATKSIPAGSLLAQGSLTPDQAADIRSTALVKLVGACNAFENGGAPDAGSTSLCDPSKLPASVNEFINNTIDRKLQKLELKLAILQQVRTLTSLGLELQQLVDDYDAALTQANVAELIPRWTLRNLDSVLMENETAQLVQAATYDLFPVLQLRYPDVFAQGLANDRVLQQELSQLVNAKWDAPVNDLATAAGQAGHELFAATSTLATTYPPVTAFPPAAFDFVRPGVTVKQPQYWSSGDGRSQQIWTAATTGNHVATIRINPEDLYHAAGGLPGLLCTQNVPVIVDFAVVLSGSRLQTSDETFFTNKAITVRSFTSPDMDFASAATLDANQDVFSAGGPLHFELKNLDWSALTTQLLVSVDPGNAVSKYNSRPIPSSNPPGVAYYVNGKGLSPFTDFTIDFSSLYDPAIFTLDKPLDLADHMIFVFTLQTRQVAPNKTMSWISSCN